SELAALDLLLEPRPARPEAHAHRRQAQSLRAPRDRLELADLVRIERHRLFDEHMLAGLQRRARDLDVRRSRRADADEMHALVGEHVLHALRRVHVLRIEETDAARTARNVAADIDLALEARRVAIAHRDEPAVVSRLARRGVRADVR